MLLGLDPFAIIDAPEDEYFIKIAMLRKAMEFRREELELQATLLGYTVAQIFSTSL